MNRIKKYLSILFVLVPILLHAQCNQQLVEKAAELAGTDAIYLRDFKVKLSEGNMDNPTPTGKFPVYLNKGVNYRFTIANAVEYEGKAYIELSRRSQNYADNKNTKDGNYVNSFDFPCHRSATYQLLLNFGTGEAGCAAIVMSMVYQDSMEYIDPGVNLVSDSSETMYLWSSTELQIASSDTRDADFRVNVSQGTIKKNGRFYIVTPEKKGDLLIKIDVFENDSLLESDSVLYQVVLPPLPRINFAGSSSTNISKRNIRMTDELKLEYPVEIDHEPYKLKSFSLALNPSGFNHEVSNGERLSFRQIELINNTEEGKIVYIIDAIFEDLNGKLHKSNSMTYMLEK